MSQTANYTSAAKPTPSGCLYRAPKGTTLPTSADSTLDPTKFICLGYLSEDGITNSDTKTSEDKKAFGGDTVLTIQTDHSDKFKFKFIEVLNKDVQATVYGEANVSGDLVNGMTVQSNADEPTPYVWVMDLIMNDDTLHRKVIPDGKITERGDTVYSSNNLAAYDVTITGIPDASGNTHYDHYKKRPVVTT